METMRAIVLVTCVISILSGLLDVLKPASCGCFWHQCLYWESSRR